MSIVGEVYKSKWMWVLTGSLVGAGLGGALTYRQHYAPVTKNLTPMEPIAITASQPPRVTPQWR